MLVGIINHSTLVSDINLAKIVEALQIQCTRDFAQFWHVDSKIELLAKDIGTYWPIHVVDTESSAPPNALAWHTTDGWGRPNSVIPVKNILDSGYDLGPTISHEYLEMVADPYCNSLISSVWPFGSRQQAWLSKEVCDPVENNYYPITIRDGEHINVSDFVTPHWFLRGGLRPLNFLNTLQHSLQISSGGYIQYYQFGKWRDQFAAQTRDFRVHYGAFARRQKRRRQHLHLLGKGL